MLNRRNRCYIIPLLQEGALWDQTSMLLLSCLVMSDSLWPRGLQHARSTLQVLHHLLELAQNHVHWICDAVQSSHPLIQPLLLLPSTLPDIRIFSNELALCIRWPKCCSFSFSISPSNECSGLISFRIDWFDDLAVHGTLQHHSSKASILQCSAFFMVGPTLTSTHDHWKNHSFD